MLKVLLGSFLNTGILLLLVSANLEYAPYFLKNIPLKGKFVDMDFNWYISISGSLVQTMLITAIFPWIEFLVFGGIRKFQRCLDRGFPMCCRKNKRTKCVS